MFTLSDKLRKFLNPVCHFIITRNARRDAEEILGFLPRHQLCKNSVYVSEVLSGVGFLNCRAATRHRGLASIITWREGLLLELILTYSMVQGPS